MALLTGEQYKESLRKMRPNCYKYGQLIQDVTTDPITKLHIDSIAHSYDMCFDEKYKPIYTAKSHLTGETAHRWNTLPQTDKDQMANAEMKRNQYRHAGTCKGATCTGWTTLTVLWAVTQEMDEQLGTNYHKRLENYFRYVEDNGLALVGAITDAKGNRTLKPSEQENKDSFLHVKEIREDGVIIRGYKAQIAGVAAANEIIIIPGSGYKESEKDFCFAGAVPKDAEGLTCVITRKPSDTRDEEEGWDAPKVGAITQSYLIFDDVFVPNDRIFMNGETKYSSEIVSYYAAIYRSAMGGCVAGQGDVMVGAAINIARANGLSQKPFQDKLNQMAINNEISYGLGLGAMLAGSQHKSGLFIPSALLAHVNKIQAAKLPHETKVLTQDIAGGIGETGCFPSYEDFQSPCYGKHLHEALKAGVDGESRARAARLIEWLTVGGGTRPAIHGGGSPDGSRLVVKAMTKWEDYAADAKRIAGIKVDLNEPNSKK